LTPDLLTDTEIAGLVRQAFPDAAIQSHRRISGQHAHLCYHLELDNLIQAALKLYLNDGLVRAEREIRLLRLITSETGVPVPRVLHYADRPLDRATPWALLTWLSGQTFAQLKPMMDDWELEAAGYEIGRYLGHIHQIRLDQFGTLFEDGPHNHIREKAHLLSLAKTWLDRCAADSVLSRPTIEALEQTFARTDLLDRRQACLVHGRFEPRHIILERGATGYHVTGIVDFTLAQAGSPEQDMVLLLDPGFQQAPTFQKGFLDGYAESGELPATFWDRLKIYRLFAALERLLRAHEREQFDRVKTQADRIDRYLHDDKHDPN
jgi:aminoglycoside phosphotransferase (APT) family kinase protein